MQYSQGPSNTGLLPNLHPVVMTTVTGLFGASTGLHQRGVQEACTGHWKGRHPWSSGRDSYSSVTNMTRVDRLKGNISVTYVALVPLRREWRLHVPPPLLLYHPRGIGSLVRLLSENLLMRCTCCLLLALRSEAAGCNHRMPMWIGSFCLHSKWTGARSASHRCQKFCYGFRVERHVSWKRCATVCNRVWDMFSLVWWVCQKCQPNQQQRVKKPRRFKETARTMGPTELIECVCCSSVYTTIEDIRKHICHESFIVT